MARPLASESLERTPRPVIVDFLSLEEGEEEEEPGFQPPLEIFLRESIYERFEKVEGVRWGFGAR